MSVNRYKILASSLVGSSGGTITIPFKMDSFPIDNTELVEKEFVELETNKSINPIIDYEKVKFIPSFSGQSNQYLNPQVPTIKIVLHNKNGNQLYYGDIGVTNDDVRYLRSRFTKTFVNFTFYNSPLPSNNKILFVNSYFTQIGKEQRNNVNFLPLDVNSMPITFEIKDPILFRDSISENYNIYWRKKDVLNSNTDVYMRVSLNNAIDGKTTQYYCVLEQPKSINSPNFYDNLFIKYTLSKDYDGKYKYFIDSTNRTIINTSSEITINLYPLTVI